MVKSTKKKVKPETTIKIVIGKESLIIEKADLKVHSGVHKVTVNRILPWIEKVLNGKI